MTERGVAGYTTALLSAGQAAMAAFFSLLAAIALITARMAWPTRIDALLYPGLVALVLSWLVSRRVAHPMLSVGLFNLGVLLIAAYGLLPVGAR